VIPKRIAAEVAEWPGAKILGVEIGRKHHRLRLAYGGKERFLMMSGSPSDRCAENNQVRDVRKVLTELGAARNQRRKATLRRQRNKPDRALPSTPIAPVKPDPWLALQALTFEPPPREGHLRAALRRLSGSVRRMVARWRKPRAQGDA
jgi:hypothetical protein